VVAGAIKLAVPARGLRWAPGQHCYISFWCVFVTVERDKVMQEPEDSLRDPDPDGGVDPGLGDRPVVPGLSRRRRLWSLARSSLPYRHADCDGHRVSIATSPRCRSGRSRPRTGELASDHTAKVVSRVRVPYDGRKVSIATSPFGASLSRCSDWRFRNGLTLELRPS
jgi:hypothetical protein